MKKLIKQLRKQADKLLQSKVSGQCLVCNNKAEVFHHFIPKSQSNFLRYDLQNCVPICQRCHSRHHLSGDPHIVSTIIEKNGLDWVNELQEKRSTICKFSIGYLEDTISKLE